MRGCLGRELVHVGKLSRLALGRLTGHLPFLFRPGLLVVQTGLNVLMLPELAARWLT